MVGAGAAQRGPHLVALGRGGLREPGADAPLARVDVDLAAGLGIDQPQVAGRHELLLARVDDLHRQHAVARAQLLERPLPVALAAEVGHDHDQAALAADGGGTGQRRAQRRRAGALGLDVAAQLGQQREQAEAALARAHDARVRRPRTRARRAGCRAAW